MGRIFVKKEMDAQFIYSALEDYLAKVDHDRRTKYDGDPDYCSEDAEFLADATARCHLLLRDLKRVHPQIVTKG